MDSVGRGELDQELQTVEVAVLRRLVDGGTPRLIPRHGGQMWVAATKEAALQGDCMGKLTGEHWTM